MRPAAFQFVAAWQQLSGEDAESVIAFWHREHADIEAEAEARRVQQVVTRVLAPDGQLVAVSTAGTRTIPRLQQPMYYYRCFVAEAWRHHALMRPLIHHTYDQLETWARAHDFPCLGLLLKLENPGFARTLQRAYWPMTRELGFSFIGRSAEGRDLRVCYFPGARLKSICDGKPAGGAC